MFKHIINSPNSCLKILTNLTSLRKFIVMTAFLCLAAISAICQSTTHQNILNLKPKENYENVHVAPIYSDSLVSSFVIWVKTAVKPHKHSLHAEQVYVMEGEAQMKVGTEEFMIKPGSFIFIPKNTVHSVITTSSIPLKVLSIQAPKFTGKDRQFIEG